MQFHKEALLKDKMEEWNSIDYQKWFQTERGKITDLCEKRALQRALKNKVYEKALDVGICDGRLLEVYSPNVKEILGVDIAPKQLQIALKKAKSMKIDLEIRVCRDISKLDIESESFDLIICSRVLQHTYNWKECIAEFSRLLRVNGDLLLLSYNRLSIFGLVQYYKNKFKNPKLGRFTNPVSLIKELKKNNLSISHYSGTLIIPPELLNEDLSWVKRRLIIAFEPFAKVFPFKYFGGRQVIRAMKVF